MSAAASAPELAHRFGLHRSGRGWRGRCPACGYGSDAFALDVRDGRAVGWCASCEDIAAIGRLIAGDGTWTPPAAVERQRDGESVQRRQERAAALWRSAVAAAGTLAATYLSRRGLAALAGSPALRFRPDTPHPAGGTHPALLALVTGADGEPAALHRTYLAADGRKAALDPPRATLGPVTGGAVRLAPAAPELVIGEGIETSASAGLLLNLPAWAAISAGNLERALSILPEVSSVVTAADRDAPGERAAQAAAARWRAEGRLVRIARPDIAGADFNDVLCARSASHG